MQARYIHPLPDSQLIISLLLYIYKLRAVYVTYTMASSRVVPMLMLFFIVFSSFFMSLQARILQGNNQAMQGNFNSHVLLHDLGFDLSKLKRYQKLYKLDAGADRVSPGGPDPHHHV